MSSEVGVDGGQLYLVRYYDHVEFRNKDYSHLGPVLREAVGWVVLEGSQNGREYIVLVPEKPARELSFEGEGDFGSAVRQGELKEPVKPSGFIILKSDILEMRKIS